MGENVEVSPAGDNEKKEGGNPDARMPTAEELLGSWADSLGNAIHVCSTDAYQINLMATLKKPDRRDIHLKMRRPPQDPSGWHCGTYSLDSTWTAPNQLHWVNTSGNSS